MFLVRELSLMKTDVSILKMTVRLKRCSYSLADLTFIKKKKTMKKKRGNVRREINSMIHVEHIN
jgi:hypothetical protein